MPRFLSSQINNSGKESRHHNSLQVPQKDGISEILSTSEQLHRVAQYVATGELPLPHELPTEQLEHLVREVRLCRRQRLVRHIAHTIAIDIHRSRE